MEEETKDLEEGKESGSHGREDSGDSGGGGSEEMPSGATTRAASRLEAQR